MAPKPQEWANRVGCLVVEGMASLGEAFKLHISKYGAGMGSMDRAWTYEEQGESFGGVGLSHYGAIQNTMYELVQMSRALQHASGNGIVTHPNLKLVVWTSLVGKGESKNTVTKYGPLVAGTAVTTTCPQWLGDCLHLHKFTQVQVEEGTGIQSVKSLPVAFFTEHPDPETGIPYLAKPRVAPASFPSLMRLYPGGYVKLETDAGLDMYLRSLEKLSKTARKGTVKWKEIVDESLEKRGLRNVVVDSGSGDVGSLAGSVGVVEADKASVAPVDGEGVGGVALKTETEKDLLELES